jgi:aldehyde:ferredoxin oxidoreductase
MTADIERAKDVYYRMAGWDGENGNLIPEKLAELGLDWVAVL